MMSGAAPTGATPVQLVKRVFISCPSQHTDRDASRYAADVVKPALERAGLEVLRVDSRILSLKKDWKQAVYDAAAHSAVLVAVFSQIYPQRFTCMQELDLAMHGLETTKDVRITTPQILPVFFGQSRADAAAAQSLSLWQECWEGSEKRGYDSTRWQANVIHLANIGKAVCIPVGAAAAELIEPTRELVKLAVAAMYQSEGMEYDWRCVAEVLAEAAVPDTDKASGLLLRGDDRTVSWTMRAVCSLLTHSKLKSIVHTPGDTEAVTADTAADWPHSLRCFSHSAVVDLAPAEGMGYTQQRSIMKSILKQLGDETTTVLYPANMLLEQLTNVTKNKAVMLLLLNVASKEQYEKLVPATMGHGSFVIASGFNGKPPSNLTNFKEVHIKQASIYDWLLQQHDANKAEPPHDLAAAAADDDNGEPHDSAEPLMDTLLQLKLQSLSPRARDMFFDVVSVLDGQAYNEVLALYNSMWERGPSTSDNTMDGTGAEAVFDELGRLVSVDLLGKLAVHSEVKELGRSYLCDSDMGAKFHFQVGSRLWLQTDGKLPHALSVAVKGDVKAVVQTAKVNAATIRKLALQNQLSNAHVLIISHSNKDNALPKHLRTKLDQLYWLDVSCGVKDISLVGPWLQHAKKLVLFRTTEAKGGRPLQAVKTSVKPLLQRWLLQERQPGISAMSESIQALSALEVLNLCGLTHLRVLPESITALPALKELRVQACSNLQELPQDIGQLFNLEVLDVSGCSSLVALPGSVGRLQRLRLLDLTGCSKMRQLPQSVFKLTGLQHYSPPSGDSSDLPEPPPVRYQLKPRPLPFGEKRNFTLLSIDGGGMRGLIPGRVLEAVEDILREEAWKFITRARKSESSREDFLRRFDRVPDDKTVKGPDNIAVDLADFFDVVSGTSTGSILASYIATKGAHTAYNILNSEQYSKGIAEYKSVRQQGLLIPGSAKAAQAMFVAAGPTIFPQKNQLKRALRFACGGSMTMCKHRPDGIDRVLQDTFGRDRAAVRLSSSAVHDGHQLDPSQPALHTSLLVPTFHLETNHAVMFWHANLLPATSGSAASIPQKPSSSSNPPSISHGWGFTTINRLKPPSWFLRRLAERRCRNGKQHFVNLQYDHVGPTKATLIFESSGDTLHVFCSPPPEKDPSASTSDASTIEEDGRKVLDFQLWEVVRSSTAAPTFFPAHSMEMKAPVFANTDRNSPAFETWTMLSGHFVDGGVVANNPTIAALSFLQRIYSESNATNTAVLSLGCGSTWKGSGLPVSGGQLHVAAPMIDIMMGANCDTATAAGEMLHRTARLNILPLASTSRECKKGSTDHDSFLRIQALAFQSSNNGSAGSGLERCHCDPLPETEQPQQQEQPQLERKPTRWANYHVIASANRGQVAAVERMDEPKDWKELLDIGADLAKHYDSDIRKWVRRYLLELPDTEEEVNAHSLEQSSTRDENYVIMERPTAFIPHMK